MINIKIHCLMRSGSTFLQKFYKEVCSIKKIDYYNIKTINDFKNQGCLCPVRIFPTGGKNEHFDESIINENLQYIVQVRDPRDVLSSQYYYFYNCIDSSTYKKEAKFFVKTHSIDDYVISDIGYKHLSEMYAPLFSIKDYKNIIFVTYEDMVLNFKKWISVATSVFNLTDIEENNLYLKFKNEFINIKETNPKIIFSGVRKSHKRKVYPGDYKNKFKNSTIEFANNKFADILHFMNEISINYKY